MALRHRLIHTALIAALAFAPQLGCIRYVSDECASCRVLNPRHPGKPEPKLPTIRRGTKRLFVLVPGALGYAWEWDPVVELLKHAPDTEFVVFWWEPFGTIKRASRDLVRSVNDLITPLEPRALEEVVIVAHSMAGVVAAFAAPELSPPDGVRLTIATIGTPFAGMIGAFGYPDDTGSFALFTSFAPRTKYPAPNPAIDFVEYRTTWPEDPVMQPRWGHDPAPASTGPRPRRRIQLPHMDHNKCVRLVVERLLKRED